MDFKEHLKTYLNDEQIEKLVSSFGQKEHKGFYLNKNKMPEKTLLSLFPNVKKHPLVPNGFLFDQVEYKLGKKVYHELGAYYIMDPSAMLVPYFLKPEKEDLILDMCAAPGGKCVLTSLLMEDSGQIIANDLSKSRAINLLSNIERMGLGNVTVTSLDFSKLFSRYQNYFDKIILDAPCSGSGMFNKLEEMKSDWSIEKVRRCSLIQKELILMAFSMLKEGGRMVYSTCSYSYEEDEEIIEYLLSKTNAKLEYIDEFAGIFRSPKYKETIHLFPSQFCGEGHYIAVITKPGNKTKYIDHKTEVFRSNFTKGNARVYDYFLMNKSIDKKFVDLALRPGLFTYSKIGEKIIESHHYSHYKNADKSIALNKEELVKYLKGESLIKNSLNDGYYCVSYLGMNAGLVHLVNEVMKNLYPKGLRHSFDIDSSF